MVGAHEKSSGKIRPTTFINSYHKLRLLLKGLEWNSIKVQSSKLNPIYTTEKIGKARMKIGKGNFHFQQGKSKMCSLHTSFYPCSFYFRQGYFRPGKATKLKVSMRILLIQHGVHGLLELFALIANKTERNKVEETSTAWTKCKINHAKVLVQKETTVAYHVVDNNIDKF